jgi:mRNA interferase RelE/StbE
MSYRVLFNRAYLKDLKCIPKNAQKQIKAKIMGLAINPRPEGVRKLQGKFDPPLYRIRCGDYRVVYSIDDGILLVLVIDVGHRKDIYESLHL